MHERWTRAAGAAVLIGLAVSAADPARAEAPADAPVAAARPAAGPDPAPADAPAPRAGALTTTTAAVAPRAGPRAPARPEGARLAARGRTARAPETDTGFADWKAAFRRQALARGIAAGLFDRAFAGVGVNATVLERDAYQPEFVRPIWAYLDSAVSPTRIETGRAKARAHRGVLNRIEERYGVDAETVVAIWGLESAYGAVMGDFRVIEALATLAHDGRRQDFAEDQLLAALRILQSGDVAAGRMTGSWAGAMGHTQFIPTSFADYAVDFTGDGRRDIWAEDPADALASTANYLARFGWRRGAPTVVRVTLPEGFDYRLADGRTERAAADWRARGVAAAEGGTIPAGEGVRLILPAGAEGPAWLAWPNFRVILRYNNATSYALAVSLLADRIAADGARSLVSALPWPRGMRPLSRGEKVELQRRLTALGHDTGGVDGIVGPDTRRAVRAFQQAAGLTPDGHVSARLLAAVRRAGG